jgi:glucokinase
MVQVSSGYPRLLGDIGGTHARWAWLSGAGMPLQDLAIRRCADDGSLHESAAGYLAATGHLAPKWACIGIATPVAGDQVRMTNSRWAFSISQLERDLGVERCLVINDFTALAMSLPALGAGDLRAVGGGTPAALAPRALLGPGTGLGVSGLVPSAAGGWSPLSGEGGHVTLAAADDEEAAVLAVLRRRFGHSSAERALSGPGLVNLFEALCTIEGRVPGALEPADVTRAALAGDNLQCQQAVRLFSGFLGNVAGNLALTLGARGGVYIGGGIVPRLGGAFDAALFRRRFEQKGRFSSYLEPVPTWVITAPAPALLGAARALDLLPA